MSTSSTVPSAGRKSGKPNAKPGSANGVGGDSPRRQRRNAGPPIAKEVAAAMGSNRDAGATFVPPDANSTTSPLGIALNDPESEVVYRLDKHGDVVNPTRVPIELAEHCRSKAAILLAQLDDGWRFGADLMFGPKPAPGLADKFWYKGPSKSDPSCGSRAEAEACAVEMLVAWAMQEFEATRNKPGERFHRASRTLKALQEFQHNLVAAQPPVDDRDARLTKLAKIIQVAMPMLRQDLAEMLDRDAAVAVLVGKFCNEDEGRHRLIGYGYSPEETHVGTDGYESPHRFEWQEVLDAVLANELQPLEEPTLMLAFIVEVAKVLPDLARNLNPPKGKQADPASAAVALKQALKSHQMSVQDKRLVGMYDGVDVFDADGVLRTQWTYENLVAAFRSTEQFAAKGKTKVDQLKETADAFGDASKAIRARHAPAAGEEGAKVIERAVMIPVEAIDRHPINRHPKQDDVAARAESIREDGQLEACEVRQMPGGRYQMISGETRWLAIKLLGQPEVRCDVIECDDATAMSRVATHNGQRKDLDPIEKALLIENVLCRPKEEGGVGLTREQAAKRVGLESGAAASNLVRLLKLPDVWQQRVSAGELPESFARLLVSVCHIPALMKELDAKFKSKREDNRAHFESRTALEDEIEYQLRHHTRDLAGRERWTGKGWKKMAIDKATLEANREALQIVTAPIYERHGGKVTEGEVALNVKLYDKLYREAEAKWDKAQAERETARAAKKGKGKGQKSLTPEEKAKRTKQLREQFELRIRNWRHHWLASVIAARLTPDDPNLLRLLAWCMCRIKDWQVNRHGHWESLLHEALELAGPKYRHTGFGGGMNDDWAQLAAAGEGGEVSLAAALVEFCRKVLTQPDHDKKYPLIPYSVMISLAEHYSIDLHAEWLQLQRPTLHPRFETFFSIYTGDQLQTLAKELDVNLFGKNTRGAMVKAFVSADRALRLPKVLELPTKREAKAKPAKKGR